MTKKMKNIDIESIELYCPTSNVWLDNNIYYVKNLTEEVYEMIRSQSVLQLDTETNISSFYDRTIKCLQLGCNDYRLVINCNFVNVKDLKEVLEESDRLYVGFNIKFDLGVLYKYGIVLKNFFDCYVAEVLITVGKDTYEEKNAKSTEEVNISLKSMLKYRLGLEIEKDTRELFGLCDGDFSLDMIRYAALDVTYLERIMNAQKKKLEKLYKTDHVWQLETDIVYPLIEIEANGMKVNEAVYMEKLELFKSRYQAAEAELRKVKDINWGTSNEFRDYLASIIPKEDLQYTDTKLLKTDKGTIASYIVFNEGTEILRTREEFNKYKKAYKENKEHFELYVDSDGRMRGSYNPVGTKTGRMSCKRENMQQRPQEIRPAFTCEEGNTLVIADYSGQEMVIMATGAKDEKLMWAVEHGYDMHSYCAKEMFPKKWKQGAEEGCVYDAQGKRCNCKEHKKLRSDAKATNFGIPYGLGPTKFALKELIPLKVAKQLLSAHGDAFPKLHIWFTKQSSSAEFDGKAFSFAPYNRFRWMLDKFYTVGRNYPIQSTAADMTKKALIGIYNELKEKKLPAFLVNVIHDEIVVECREDVASEVAEIVERHMLASAKEILQHTYQRVDCKISKVWEK